MARTRRYWFPSGLDVQTVSRRRQLAKWATQVNLFVVTGAAAAAVLGVVVALAGPRPHGRNVLLMDPWTQHCP